jgi:hypothetical protein
MLIIMDSRPPNFHRFRPHERILTPYRFRTGSSHYKDFEGVYAGLEGFVLPFEVDDIFGCFGGWWTVENQLLCGDDEGRKERMLISRRRLGLS